MATILSYALQSIAKNRCHGSNSIVACRDVTLRAPTPPGRSPKQSNIVVNGIDVGPPLSRAGAVQLTQAFDGLRVIGLQARSHRRVLQRV
jgi:hypothetical protein